ncbi:MAG: hypothetical protein HGA22_08680 [Clostridiales bacterium]|nr:hypothetical protein [Clostridiales bacterium]
MFSYNTKYGDLNGISFFSTYPDGKLKDCTVNEMSVLETPVGKLVPQFEHTGLRRRFTNSVSLYPDGSLSRLALETQTMIETAAGTYPAEFITFHKNGAVKKLFPLNGKLSGYWDEDNEYGLAEDFEFSFSFAHFSAKIISIGFYESGAIKGISLWPREVVTLTAPIGEYNARAGFSMFEDGSLKSFEPAGPIDVLTPIGRISAYNANANSLSAENNSVVFSESGGIRSIITSTSKIIVTGGNRYRAEYSPGFSSGMGEDELFFNSLRMDFVKNGVCFNNKSHYNLADNNFRTEPYFRPAKEKCSSCSGCSGCSATAI